MTDKSHEQNESNIVLYPGLVRRLLELGMDSLKAKDGQAAYDYFQQAEKVEPENPKVRFGMMLSLVELGRLDEAVQMTDKLLKEGTGDYFENLQVHISLLVQLSRYEEVIEILDAVLAENRFPPQHAETLYKLLHFSRQMTDGYFSTEFYPTEVEPDDSGILQTEHLQSDSPEVQWQAIQSLNKANLHKATPELITYIEDPNKDLLLRSYALQLLMKWEISSEVTISKLGRTKTIVPAKLVGSDGMTAFSNKIKDILSEQLEHENPILHEMATQLMIMHLLVLFPFLPEENEVNVYAASFHLLACDRLALDDLEEEIADQYSCSVSDVLEKVAVIEELEQQIFKQGPTDFRDTDT
ncbi:tetratricopeptide repeat protein [Alkalicoccobacillus murimartini]|uniref:Tetratricopeptide (TPR) repeat protein n=1 Tax=Alkalicoccobacillus murimartini TaxID=171685 RepID=A0ABT9YK48_9BACI|nr:tetratricopeptide repeat protein [Alkalicoccobacillus murimartini]MDQ0208029.1 tetratricopeptide (TPR) repeat protein [Alkalicoccobacillus murimartini]